MFLKWASFDQNWPLYEVLQLRISMWYRLYPPVKSTLSSSPPSSLKSSRTFVPCAPARRATARPLANPSTTKTPPSTGLYPTLCYKEATSLWGTNGAENRSTEENSPTSLRTVLWSTPFLDCCLWQIWGGTQTDRSFLLPVRRQNIWMGNTWYLGGWC